MKKKILLIERNFWENAGIEKVFRQIIKDICKEDIEIDLLTVKYRNSLPDIIKNLLFFKRPKADIYHITGQIHYLGLILPKKNTILTIHDLIFLHNRTGLRRFLLKKLFLDLPVKRLNYITAISQATKNEIVKFTGCSPEKITVIENPLFDEFNAEPKKEFNELEPLILHIGTAENKNIERLVEALNGLSCKLKIIGKVENRIIRKIKNYNIKFENDFGLDEKEIKHEYQNADIVSFCSTYEGFGLPIIEAQAMKTPVITSNIDPMKSVAGDGAVLVDPLDINSIRKGFIKVISDEVYRNCLINKGLSNTKRFESKVIAQQYKGLYEEVTSLLIK